MWTQNTCIIHDVWRLLILSNEEKTNDYENFEKGMIYMNILKKGGGSREKGEEEAKSMPHAPVVLLCCVSRSIYNRYPGLCLTG